MSFCSLVIEFDAWRIASLNWPFWENTAHRFNSVNADSSFKDRFLFVYIAVNYLIWSFEDYFSMS